MTKNNVFIKDPDAILDYSYNWADWLVAGDSIDSSTWFISDSGLSNDLTSTSPLEIDSASFSGAVTTVVVSKGLSGANYFIVNRITTNGGRTDDRHIQLRIMNR